MTYTPISLQRKKISCTTPTTTMSTTKTTPTSHAGSVLPLTLAANTAISSITDAVNLNVTTISRISTTSNFNVE